VEHLIFLFNLLTLLAGLTVAAGLLRAWKTERTAASFWQFLHFSGFTFTMVAAALDAYGVVNLGVGAELTRFWSSWVMAGTALMLFSFPHLARAQAGRPRGPRFSGFWASLALVPAAAAVSLAILDDYALLLGVIFLGFLPFWGSIFYSLAVAPPSRPSRRWEGWLVLLVLGCLGAAEVWWILGHPSLGGYYFVTLPLAYLYTAWSTWRLLPRRRPAASGTDRVPEPLARSWGLTAREREMAQGILRGLSNKELAFELRLSENTVRNHISNLYRKLGIQKRLDLVLLVQKYQGP